MRPGIRGRSRSGSAPLTSAALAAPITTDILVSEAYRWAFSREAQYGYAAAYAVLIFLILTRAPVL